MKHIDNFHFIRRFGKKQCIKMTHTPVKKRNAMMKLLTTSKTDSKTPSKSKTGTKKRRNK